MTLVVAVTTPESIWLLADRRLCRHGRQPIDDGQKVMVLETTDGVAILGYAGLGATARGTEPATWMSGVLRGRTLRLEQSLDVLARAMHDQLPRHMASLPASTPAHHVIAVAFVEGEPRAYSIDLVLRRARNGCDFRYTRWVVDRPPRPRATPWLALAGTGGEVLVKNETWMRPLLRVVRAHDNGKISRGEVAKCFANLSYDVSLLEKSVGPRCTIVWRARRGGRHKMGGDVWCYAGLKREADSTGPATISNGMDIRALSQAIMPIMMKNIMDQLAHQPISDSSRAEETAAMNAALALLPDKPEERLT